MNPQFGDINEKGEIFFQGYWIPRNEFAIWVALSIPHLENNNNEPITEDPTANAVK